MIERDDDRRAELFVELAETGSEAARTELIESFAPLAEFFANRYRNRGAEQEDLRQVAQLALVKAVDRFDLSFDVQFSTFAGRTIDGELKRYFRDRTWSVRVPRSLKEMSIEVRKVSDQLAAELDRSPSVAELAEATGFEQEQIIEALDVQTAYRATSIDKPTNSGDDGDLTLGATLASVEKGYEQTTLALAVESLLETLPERERTIVQLRFFEDLSQSQIAERVGVSQMHVSRLLRKSLEQLRERVHASV